MFHNQWALAFIDFWQQKLEVERFRTLGKYLGVLWTREDVQKKETDKESHRDRTPIDELFIPLAATLEPEIQDMVRKIFGRKLGIQPPDWAQKTEVEDMWKWDRGEFLSFVQSFVRPRVLGNT